MNNQEKENLDLTKELSELLICVSNIAVEIRSNSSYVPASIDNPKCFDNDNNCLPDLFHNLTSLSHAILINNRTNITNICDCLMYDFKNIYMHQNAFKKQKGNITNIITILNNIKDKCNFFLSIKVANEDIITEFILNRFEDECIELLPKIKEILIPLYNSDEPDEAIKNETIADTEMNIIMKFQKSAFYKLYIEIKNKYGVVSKATESLIDEIEEEINICRILRELNKAI